MLNFEKLRSGGAGRKRVWGKRPEGVASQPYGVKIPAPPSLGFARKFLQAGGGKKLTITNKKL